MRSRFRLVAALLALLSPSLTMAAAVRASTCTRGMEMGAPPAAMEAASTARAAGMAMQRSAGAERAHGTETGSDAPGVPHCPLTTVPGSCLVLTISIPAHAPESFVPSPEGAAVVASPGDARHILLASSFFRPPRA
ncbi:MAG TPA: hypothetical protein VFL93_09850 [Longimicrobiaceae bacterium]|nr:hypothetical protein [Longimicrobiaceae bacterium]